MGPSTVLSGRVPLASPPHPPGPMGPSAGAQPSPRAARGPGWAPGPGHRAAPTPGRGLAVTCSRPRAVLGRPIWVLGQSGHPQGRGIAPGMLPLEESPGCPHEAGARVPTCTCGRGPGVSLPQSIPSFPAARRGPGGPGLTGWALPQRPGRPASRCGWPGVRGGGKGRGRVGAHLALLLLQLDLDVGELGPKLLVGGLQRGEGLGPVPLAPAAHALLGHGEGGPRGSGGGRLCGLGCPRQAAAGVGSPPLGYIFSLTWRESTPG